MIHTLSHSLESNVDIVTARYPSLTSPLSGFCHESECLSHSLSFRSYRNKKKIFSSERHSFDYNIQRECDLIPYSPLSRERHVIPCGQLRCAWFAQHWSKGFSVPKFL